MFLRTIGLAAAVAIGAAMSTPAFAADQKTSDEVRGTKLGNLPYTKAPESIGEPTGQKMTGAEIQKTLKGKRVVFVGPEEQGIQRYDAEADTVVFHRATGPETKGTWRVQGDQYCVTWDADQERCYDVYRDSERGFSIWLQNRPVGRISIH